MLTVHLLQNSNLIMRSYIPEKQPDWFIILLWIATILLVGEGLFFTYLIFH